MKKIIAILFIIIGLVLISYPLLTEWNQAQEVRALEDALSLISDADGEDVVLENIPFTEEELRNVLELEIPAINLKQNILSETTDANLDIALTQIKENQAPGEGNFTVAGHRGYRDGRHFSNLAKVPIGEQVMLHDKDKTYVYEITSSEVVAPTAVEVLDDQDGEDEITMITCTVTGTNRIAVKGKLVEIQ